MYPSGSETQPIYIPVAVKAGLHASQWLWKMVKDTDTANTVHKTFSPTILILEVLFHRKKYYGVCSSHITEIYNKYQNYIIETPLIYIY